MLVTVIALKYALCWLASDRMDIFVNKLIQFSVNNSINLGLLTPRIMRSYTPQHGDRIVTIDSVTSLHPMY